MLELVDFLEFFLLKIKVIVSNGIHSLKKAQFTMQIL